MLSGSSDSSFMTISDIAADPENTLPLIQGLPVSFAFFCMSLFVRSTPTAYPNIKSLDCVFWILKPLLPRATTSSTSWCNSFVSSGNSRSFPGGNKISEIL